MLKIFINFVFCNFLILGAVATPLSFEEMTVIKLVDYAKGKVAYSATQYQGGYHTITLGETVCSGQRDPQKRLQHVPYDFTGKNVLDIGSNEGGMLFAIANKISHGVGIDFNSKLVNVANKLKSYYGTHNVDFYVFDLEKEPLKCLASFLKQERVDICFLLSVCCWIKNWKQVIDTVYRISDTLLFESNGYKKDQTGQINYLKKKYLKVTLLSEISDDDPKYLRQLYFCSKL